MPAAEYPAYQACVPAWKPRVADSHKGTYGHALIVGGSRGMSGAVALAGIAALQSGAGLVSLAVPDRCLETVASFHPCYMTIPLPNDERGRLHAEAAPLLHVWSKKATSIGIGPGLSQSESITDLFTELYVNYAGPMIVDADALNALAGAMANRHELRTALSQPRGPRILTPHVGEFRRLANDNTLSPDACRQRATEFAKLHQVIVVLKGSRTLVTDGTRHFENETGNPGMATAGAGDVLTGVITAICGQSYGAFDAAVLGVHLHGRAGDAARDTRGEVSLTARDIADHLCVAFRTQSNLDV